MNCPYEGKCWDARSEKCGTCMHNEERSYYVEYHEYPAEKWPDPPSQVIGVDLRYLPATQKLGNVTLGGCPETC